MRRATRAVKRPDVCLRLDPNSPERILISTNENLDRDGETGHVRYRRRTTSFKGRRQAEKRRASLPAFYRLNIKPKATRKNLLQKIGSRLAQLGDDLVKRKNSYTAGNIADRRTCDTETKSLKKYARQLAEVGDYLNTLYSSEGPLACSESYHTTLAENCLVLTSILIGLKNDNVVVVSTSDLSTLTSLCRVHRVKSLSRARK